MEMYKEFKRFMGSRSVSASLLHYIQDNQLENDLLGFYPKNWFTDGADPEMILFTQKDIKWVKRNRKTLEIDVYKDYKVTKLSYMENINDRYAGSKLTISLESGDQLTLNASNDANEDWVETFSQYIEVIFKVLK